MTNNVFRLSTTQRNRSVVVGPPGHLETNVAFYERVLGADATRLGAAAAALTYPLDASSAVVEVVYAAHDAADEAADAALSVGELEAAFAAAHDGVDRTETSGFDELMDWCVVSRVLWI